jgi:hypothetical protein
VELRARCQRQPSSLVTPMGDETFYRYQQSLIDEAATTLGCAAPAVVNRQQQLRHSDFIGLGLRLVLGGWYYCHAKVAMLW